MRVLAAFLLLRLVHALATTSPAAHTFNTPLGHILVGLVTSPTLRLPATLLLIRPVHVLATTSPAALHHQAYSVRFSHLPNFAPSSNSFTDLPSSCFRSNLSSSPPPAGSFRLVQSPPPTLGLLATRLLIRAVHALGPTSPAAPPQQAHFVRFSHLPQLCDC